MYCVKCGKEVPDEARFCRNCGASMEPPAGVTGDAPVTPQAAETPASQRSRPVPPPLGEPPSTRTGRQPTTVRFTPPPTPPGGRSPGGPGAPGNDDNRVRWIVVAALAVVVLAIAITVPLVLAGDGDEQVTTSSTRVETTTTTEPETTTSAPTSTTSTTATTTAPGPAGDSAGEWVETEVPGIPGEIVSVALSDDVLLMQSYRRSGYSLYSYGFGTDQLVEIPISDGTEMSLDGLTAVWLEGEYDNASGTYLDRRIYLYDLANHEKREIFAGGGSIGYPQIAGAWVTWIEGGPLEPYPDEYWHVPIYGSLLSSSGAARNPTLLAPSAVAAIMGDSTWTYSLSENYLAWEQATPLDGFETGSYVLDLSAVPGEPRLIGSDAWRPSLYQDYLIYWQGGLRFQDLKTGKDRDIDLRGDFAAAGPTFAAYYRSVAAEGGSGYEIVARGYTGGYEQVLSKQADPPWLAPPIHASENRVAFVSGGAVHVFEWKGR